jgi:hypothetical protein
MICPFAVGDRIHEVRYPPIIKTGLDDEVSPVLLPESDPTKPDATVTSFTARGFTYRYDRPIQWGRAEWGTVQEGECYEGGFMMWERI